ncbi:MAG: iron(III) transport system substrate-binding protein [Alphaproteobacteria bacterium]|jgi:iron(III) transport system substrate-binding protein|nr:iron(III) transport system substrate-binding protein [Alphaproteobacteria bacterium]
MIAMKPISPMAACILVAAGLTLAAPAGAQAPRPWLVPELLSAATSEGNTLTIYASMNEEEALPFWSVFEQATGIKVNFLRMTDSGIRARVAIEHRARQRTWDLVATPPVYRLGEEILAQFDPPQAKDLIPQARDPNRRWYGIYSNYFTPAYNTAMIKPAELPKTYEEFVDRKQWAGKVAIDASDADWLTGMFMHYGEERGGKLARDLVAALKPVVLDGHLNVARQVGAGEYWVALNNFLPLTLNVKLAGGPTDFWALDPVTLAFGSIGINSQAPHPKTALLAANYLLSQEGQTFLTRKGRLPSRPDVATNPPGVMDVLRGKAIVVPVMSGSEQRKMQQTFNAIFRPR